MALVQKAFSDIITFSRSSNATRVGPTGLVEYAPHNLQTRSEAFDGTIYYVEAGSYTNNVIAAPNGTITGAAILEGTTFYTRARQNISVVNGGTYTYSAYFKSGTRTQVQMQIYSDDTDVDSVFDLSTGTIVYGATSTIVSVGNGWYRCSVTGTVGSTSAITFAYPAVNGSYSYTHTNGATGIYIWGAQLSVGPYALDYTPTTSAAVYGPRFDYDPVTLAARGLLVEEQRTNLATYSEAFDNAAWTKLNASVTANSTTSPDGTTSADYLIPNTSSGQHGVYQALSAVAGTPYTQSVFAKAGGYNWLFMTEGNNVTAQASFNLATGVVGTVAGTGSPSATITALANGWYRCTFTYTPIATSQNIQIRAANADAGPTFTGDGTSGIYIWGAQLE